MIIKTISLGYKVSDFDPNDSSINELKDRVKIIKPLGSKIMKTTVSNEELENGSQAVVFTCVLSFNDEEIQKARVTKLCEDFQVNFQDEIEQFILAKGLVFNKILTM